MLLKIWPNGSIVEEEKGWMGCERNYGHSDDYFVIDLDEDRLEVIERKILDQFGHTLQMTVVLTEVMGYYHDYFNEQ